MNTGAVPTSPPGREFALYQLEIVCRFTGPKRALRFSRMCRWSAAVVASCVVSVNGAGCVFSVAWSEIWRGWFGQEIYGNGRLSSEVGIDCHASTAHQLGSSGSN